MITDKERIDFLESLLGRAMYPNKRHPAYFLRTDIHIAGPEHCSIYARTGVGSNIDFQGHGKTVREAIDAALAEQNETPLT